VANFVGLSNQVPAELDGGLVTVLGKRLELINAPMPDGPVTAFVRPEDIVLDPKGLSATVVTSSFLGSLRRTQARLGDGFVVSFQHDVADALQPGDSVNLRLKGKRVLASPRV